MAPERQPLSVTIVGCVYIAVGVAGFVFHFKELWSGSGFHYDGLLIEFVEIVAILSGAFLLRGQNWARWLAMAWITFHVVFSAFDALRKLTIHSLFFVVIAWCLFHPSARRYFRGTRIETT